MSGNTPSFLDRFRQPEYTGENRCTPCTIVNSVIAVVLAAVVGLALATTQSTAVGAGAAVVVLAGSALAIGLRGYLVPGTPTLTKRYFPDRVLAWFDKEPATLREDDEGEETNPWRTDIDGDKVERILQDAGALEECEQVDDLCVTETFRTVWWDHIERIREGDRGRGQLANILDIDPDEISLEDMDGVFMAKQDRSRLGKWESEAAFLADMGAAAALEEVYSEGWARLNVRERSAVLNGVRVFLERCPDCDGVVTLGEKTVESCCRELEVVAVACDDCGERLFETNNEMEASMAHP